MSPSPVAATAPTIPATTAPAPPAAQAEPKPTVAGTPGATPPTGAPPAAAPAAATGTGEQAVMALLQSAKAIRDVAATGVSQAQSAVKMIPKDSQVPDQVKASLARINIVGQLLGVELPKETKALSKGTDPFKAIVEAEKSVQTAVDTALKTAVSLEGKVDVTKLPEDVVKAFKVGTESIQESFYWVVAANRLAPDPAPVAPKVPGAAPAPATTPTTKP